MEPEIETGTGTPSEDSILLEGTTADNSVRSDTEISSPPRLRWVVVGLAGLIVVVFGLSRWQQGEPAPPTAEEEGAAGDENADNNDTPDDNELSEPGDGPEVDDEPSTTVEPQQVVPGSGPVLGEDTGLALIISQPANGQLRLLDLDSGTEYELAAKGLVVGTLDSQLVIQRSGVLSALPLDSPEESGTELVSADQGWIDVVGVTDDAVWIVRQNELTGPIGNDFTIDGYDSSGNLIDDRTLDGSSLSLGPAVWDELSQEIGGGIYRREGNRYQRLSSGWITAAGDELALVRECDERRQCNLNWYRTVGWVGRYRVSDWDGPLPLPTPEVTEVGSWLTMRGNDRWLVDTNWSTGYSRIIDVTTGQVVREQRTELTNGPQPDVPFSPDGRWLMEDDVVGIRIIDLDNGTEYAYESDLTSPSSTLTGFFIDRDDVGFLP